jgi:hypothetical protein
VQAYAPGAKDLHTGLKGMSVDQLEGMLKGYTLKQAAAEQQARLGEYGARMQDYQAQAALRGQQGQSDAVAGDALRNYGSYVPPEGQSEKPGDRMRYALSQVPSAGGRYLPKVIESLEKYEQLLNPSGKKTFLRPGEYGPATVERFAGHVSRPDGAKHK